MRIIFKQQPNTQEQKTPSPQTSPPFFLNYNRGIFVLIYIFNNITKLF